MNPRDLDVVITRKLVAENDTLRAGIAELEAWKQSSMNEWESLNLQAIGKALSVPLGSAIPPAILPGISALKIRIKELEETVRFINYK